MKDRLRRGVGEEGWRQKNRRVEKWQVYCRRTIENQEVDELEFTVMIVRGAVWNVA